MMHYFKAILLLTLATSAFATPILPSYQTQGDAVVARGDPSSGPVDEIGPGGAEYKSDGKGNVYETDGKGNVYEKGSNGGVVQKSSNGQIKMSSGGKI
jgi:hypothetical protein